MLPGMHQPLHTTGAAGPFGRFRDDHRRVLGRLDDLERIATDPVRGETGEARFAETLDLLARQFATHMIAEDRVLYPVLAVAFPESRAVLAPLHVEHIELRLMLAALGDTVGRSRGPAREEQLLVRTRDFVTLLRLHIRKEDHSVFDLAERVLRPHEVRELVERLEASYALGDPERGG